MSMVIRFFEKTNCTGNARQKAILVSAGYQLQTEDLLSYPFTRAELRAFFGELPISQWFNPLAPKIRDGELVIEGLSEEQALDLMLAEPLLIRRPLLQIGEQRLVGFDVAQLERLGIQCQKSPRLNLLSGEDLEGCPGHALGIQCDEPRTLPKLD